MKTILIVTTAAAAIGALILTAAPARADAAHHRQAGGAASAQAQADPPAGGMKGPGGMTGHGGMMGQGTGPGMMMGPGMMGAGMGPCGALSGARDLSADNVKDILEGHLAWTGNKRLKVGNVTTKDDDTYLAEIVTVDNSLVQKLEVDRKTGMMRPTE